VVDRLLTGSTSHTESNEKQAYIYALVHSSTLVTAGVYLLIRFSPSFSSWLNIILLLISGLTIFMAGFGDNFEFDLRRIIALSTLSQLGLMIITISIGLSSLAFFHLLTHALFKVLLFMCAGGVIHSMGDSQDIRFMGGLSVYMPFTSASLMVSNFALCGIPFLAGFYSRDFILEMFSIRYVNVFGFFLLFVSTGLTVFYSFRLFYFIYIYIYIYISRQISRFTATFVAIPPSVTPPNFLRHEVSLLILSTR